MFSLNMADAVSVETTPAILKGVVYFIIPLFNKIRLKLSFFEIFKEILEVWIIFIAYARFVNTI